MAVSGVQFECFCSDGSSYVHEIPPTQVNNEVFSATYHCGRAKTAQWSIYPSHIPAHMLHIHYPSKSQNKKADYISDYVPPTMVVKESHPNIKKKQAYPPDGAFATWGYPLIIHFMLEFSTWLYARIFHMALCSNFRSNRPFGSFLSHGGTPVHHLF